MKEIILSTGDLIRIHRKRLLMSQEELGFRIGADQKTISEYECNRRRPQRRLLRRLAKALHVTEADLQPTWKRDDTDKQSNNPLSPENIDKTILSLLVGLTYDVKCQIYRELERRF